MNIRSYTMLFLASLILVLTVLYTNCKQEADVNSSQALELTKNASPLQKGFEAYGEKDHSIAKEYFQLALKQARDRKLGSEISDCIFMLAMCENHIGTQEKTIELFNQYINFPESITNPKKRSRSFSNLANIYQKRGEYDKAVDHFYKALRIAEEQQNNKEIAKVHYELGLLHHYREEYEKALESYKQSEKYSKGDKNKRRVFIYLAAIGSAYGQLEKYDTSLYYNLQSLELAKETQVPTDLAYAYQNTGSNYVNLKKYKEAEEYLLKAFEINDTTNEQFAKLGVIRDLGNLYTNTKQYNKALAYLNQGLPIAKEIQSKSRSLELYETLAMVYEADGQLNKAIESLKEKSLLKNEMINEESEKAINEVKVKWGTEKKENEIALLKKKKEITSLYIYIFIGAIGFILSMLIFYIRKNKKERLLNQELEERNKQIELQNKKLAEINYELNQFTSVASHDLKSPLRTVASFANLLIRRYRDKLDDEADEYLGFIQSGVKRMISMLDDLLSYAKVGKKDIPFEMIDSSEIVMEALFNLQENIRVEGATVNVEKGSLPEINANRTLMVQLFQNLIANAIKFRSKNDPKVIVDCIPNGKEHTFMIKDNGIGIDPDYQDKIFEMFGRINGKTEYEGTGIGLATCKKIVTNHGGKIWVESENGKGSTFFFSVPKPKVLEEVL